MQTVWIGFVDIYRSFSSDPIQACSHTQTDTGTQTPISNAISQIDFYNCTYAHLFILITSLRSSPSLPFAAVAHSFFFSSAGSCAMQLTHYTLVFDAFYFDSRPTKHSYRSPREKLCAFFLCFVCSFAGGQPNDWSSSQTTTTTKKNNHLWFAFDKFVVDAVREYLRGLPQTTVIIHSGVRKEKECTKMCTSNSNLHHKNEQRWACHRQKDAVTKAVVFFLSLSAFFSFIWSTIGLAHTIIIVIGMAHGARRIGETNWSKCRDCIFAVSAAILNLLRQKNTQNRILSLHISQTQTFAEKSENSWKSLRFFCTMVVACYTHMGMSINISYNMINCISVFLTDAPVNPIAKVIVLASRSLDYCLLNALQWHLCSISATVPRVEPRVTRSVFCVIIIINLLYLGDAERVWDGVRQHWNSGIEWESSWVYYAFQNIRTNNNHNNE